MAKKYFCVFICAVTVFVCAQYALSMTLIGGYPGPDTLPNGLRLTDFQVQGPVPLKTGDQILVSFRLINTSSNIIQFDPRYGVFVGSRWNSTSNANNRDFGHNYKGATLMPTQAIVLQARRTIEQEGTWRFWPAFHIGGKWGPFRWHEVVVQAQQAPRPPRPPRRPPPAKP